MNQIWWTRGESDSYLPDVPKNKERSDYVFRDPKYNEAMLNFKAVLILDRARIGLAPPGCKPGALPLC